MRLEAGEEQILTSDFTQFEPLTSYKLGSSTFAVDMTSSDWPLLGKGIVNTSKASDIYGTQQYQPKATNYIYTRRWDETPPSPSDDFNSVSLDTDVWNLVSGNISLVTYPGNLAFEWNANVSSKWSISSALSWGVDIGVDFPSPLTGGNSIALIFQFSGGSIAGFQFGASGGLGTIYGGVSWAYHGIDFGPQTLSIRRAENTISLYKNDVLLRQGVSGFHGQDVVKFYISVSGFAPTKIDHVTVVDGLVTGLIGTAHWSPWFEQLDAQSQSDANQSQIDVALLTHETNKHATGVTGSFTTTDGKTVTITDGMVTSIV